MACVLCTLINKQAIIFLQRSTLSYFIIPFIPVDNTRNLSLYGFSTTMFAVFYWLYDDYAKYSLIGELSDK